MIDSGFFNSSEFLGIVITTLIAVFAWMIKQSHSLGRFLEKMDGLVDKMDSLSQDFKEMKNDVSILKVDVAVLKSGFKVFKKEISKVKLRTTKLEQDMATTRVIFSSDFGVDFSMFDSDSPLSLTPKGMRILKSSGFVKFYKENSDYFLRKIKKHKPQRPAQIDRISNEIMFDMRGKKLQNIKADMEDTAYEAGIELLVLQRAAAIYLRDKAIKELLEK